MQALIDALAAAPRFPLEFIGGFADMPSLFKAFSSHQQLPNGYVERISNLLPASIRKLPCFLDRLTGVWRYDYGDPIETAGGGTVIGTHMFHDVEQLFEVVCCAEWRLQGKKRDAYLTRLSDSTHHEDALVEFAPILRLDAEAMVEYEVSGHGSGNRTVDWSICAPGHPELLLEVKNRIRDLVESFETIKSQPSEQPIPAPTHDHALLFKSIEEKFRPRKADEVIQGVWIRAGLRQEETELRAAFDALDSQLVHFAVLGSWGEESYVLSKDVATKRRVQRILSLRNTKGLVFRRSY